MKQRFNDQAGCAHAWANAHYDEGYASNFFFDGPVIYSYGRHFPIAYNSGNNVFFTLSSYSKSTAIHKAIAKSAVSHKNIIYVHEVPTHQQRLSNDSWIRSNIEHWTKKITEALNELQLHPRRKRLMQEIGTHKIELLAFIQMLNIPLGDKLLKFLHDPSISSFDVFIKNVNYRRNIQSIKKHKQEVLEWRKGIRQRINYDNLYGIYANKTYLRLNTITNRIETSKEIKIPVEIAKRFWLFIQTQLPVGCANCDYSMFGYKVDYTNSKEIKIGCHTIPMKEARAIAKKLRW